MLELQPLSFVLYVMATAIFCVWAAHTFTAPPGAAATATATVLETLCFTCAPCYLCHCQGRQNELSVCPVTAKKSESELSACPVMAKKAIYELLAYPVMTIYELYACPVFSMFIRRGGLLIHRGDLQSHLLSSGGILTYLSALQLRLLCLGGL